jgi:hypothetical protein
MTAVKNLIIEDGKVVDATLLEGTAIRSACARDEGYFSWLEASP